MKYLKKYEEIEEATYLSEAQIGDYVICYDETFIDHYDPYVDKIMNEFLENNVGKIIDYNSEKYHYDHNIRYIVKYQDIPEEIEKYFVYNNGIRSVRGFRRKEILYSSKDKEELEILIATNKYNL